MKKRRQLLVGLLSASMVLTSVSPVAVQAAEVPEQKVEAATAKGETGTAKEAVTDKGSEAETEAVAKKTSETETKAVTDKGSEAETEAAADKASETESAEAAKESVTKKASVSEAEASETEATEQENKETAKEDVSSEKAETAETEAKKTAGVKVQAVTEVDTETAAEAAVVEETETEVEEETEEMVTKAADADENGFVIDDSGVLTKYSGTSMNVEIPGTVTKIGDSAFKDNTNILSVKIPDSVKIIGDNAFNGCSNLKSISIPDGVESIGGWAFYGCEKLLSITLPSKITDISAGTFRGCKTLTSVEIPDGVVSIAVDSDNYYGAFRDCTSLQKVIIPDSVTSIGKGTFRGCSKSMIIYCGVHSKAKEFAETYGLNYDDGRASQTITAEDITKILGTDENTFSIGATTNGEDTTLTYTTDDLDGKIAKVDKNTGEVTLVGEGEVNITIKASESDEYLPAEKDIVLTVQKYQTVSIKEDKITKTYGDDKFKLSPESDRADDEAEFTYKSSDTDVVSVDKNGNVSIIGAGEAKITITAKASGVYLEGTKDVTVTVKKKEQTIKNASDVEATYGDNNVALSAYSDNRDAIITYTSDDTDNKVIKIDEDNKLSFVGAGTAHITVKASETANYLKAEKTITVTVKKKKQSVTAADVTMTYGDEEQKINASSTWSDAKLSYTSEDESIATVNVNGKITAVKAGTVLITVTADGGDNYEDASCQVEVKIAKKDQTLNAEDITKVYGDDDFSIGAESDNAKAELTYTSDDADKEVIDVDDKGQVKIIGVGTAKVTVAAPESDNYKEASKTITITIAKRDQEVTAADVTKTYGDEPFAITAKSDYDKAEFTYESLNPEVLSVDAETGKATIVAAGTAEVKVKAAGGAYYSDAEKVVKVTVNKANQNVTAADITKTYGDAAFNIEAASDCANANLTYASSNKEVISVDAQTGRATVAGVGTATITVIAAETENYLSTKKEITVTVVKKDQVITASDVTKTYGDASFALDAFSSAANVKVYYESGNPDVAAVDTAGNIVIKGAGTASITVKAPATANYNAAQTTITLIVNKKKQTIDADDAEKVFGDTPFNIIESSTQAESLTYTSDNQNVATVDAAGNVTVVGAGTASITITAPESANYLGDQKVVTVEVAKKETDITADDITKTYTKKAFSVNATVDSDSALTYSIKDKKVATIDKNGKITLKGYGQTEITIHADETANYEESESTILLTVNPVKASLSSVKYSKEKTMTVKWKRDSSATGYVIQYSTDKKFKKGVKSVTVSKNKTTSKTISKLTGGKKYYVRICSYKKSNGKNIQGAYSKVKNVKIKK